MNKPQLEFTSIENIPFTPCQGAVPGLRERILSADRINGLATRILRFDPDTDTTANGVQVHDFWEEVYIVEGVLTDVPLGQTFSAGSYACRPPGMPHGPWISGPEGCTTFEVRYQQPSARTRD